MTTCLDFFFVSVNKSPFCRPLSRCKSPRSFNKNIRMCEFSAEELFLARYAPWLALLVWTGECSRINKTLSLRWKAASPKTVFAIWLKCMRRLPKQSKFSVKQLSDLTRCAAGLQNKKTLFAKKEVIICSLTTTSDNEWYNTQSVLLCFFLFPPILSLSALF